MFKKLFSFFHKTKTAIRMPRVRGILHQNVPLAKKTWFGAGGSAQYYFEPADEKDLAHFIRYVPNIPIFILGGGSNVLIRDKGIVGVVIHLGKPFADAKKEDDTIVCGAGLLSIDLARFALKSELGGFEFLSGIPGSVGGALRMNAGAYGSEIKDILVSLRFVDSNGSIQELTPEEDFFEYRKNKLPDDWIFTGATFKGVPERAENIAAKMADFKQKREANQPMGVKTCGSSFKNPEGLKAWELIDKAGLRGFRIGDAMISEKHTNFIINRHHASAQELEDLGEEVRRRVHEKSGVWLDWEIKRWGIGKKEKDEE